MADKKTYSIVIDGIKQSVDGVQSLGNAVNTNSTNMKELKKALKETKDEMVGLEKYSDEWNELAKVAGDYKDQIDDINQATKRWASDTKALDDALNIGKSMTSVFTLAKGAMSAFGMSTEGAVEQIQKLQGAMAILQSIQSLQNALRGSTATTDLLSKAMKACTVSMKGATTATKVLKVALASIGIGLLIIAVTELIEHWEDLTSWFNKSSKAANENAEAINKGTEAYAKAKAELQLYQSKVESFNGTKEQEKQLVDELNKKYGEAFGQYQTLAQWKDILKKKTEAYAQSLALEAKMQVLVNQLSDAYKNVAEAKKEFNRVREGDLTYWEQIKDFCSPGGVLKDAREGFHAADHEVNQLEESIQKLAEEIAKHNEDNSLFDFSPQVKKGGAKSVKEIKSVLKNWIDAEKDAEKTLQTLIKKEQDARKKQLEEEQKAIEKLNKLRKKGIDLEYDYQKAQLNNQLAEAKTDEEKIEIKKKLIELDKKRQEEAAKATAAEEMGISIEELNKRLEVTDEKWINLNDTQKEVLKNLQKQLETIKVAADTANKSLNGETTSPTDEKKESGLQTLLNDKLTNYILSLQDVVIEGIEDAFVSMLEFEIEEAEEKLNEVAELHEKAIEKVSDSKDRLSELNDQMKESSGAQLEQYKQQIADEMLLLQEREQEERRLAKEKEKREKELEKKERQQRKAEVGFQIAQAIINTGLAVTKAFGQWGWPLGAVFGAILSALGTAQIAIMTKQYSKLADGGLLQGKSHSQGGIPVGNTGIEVEGGEFVVSKRATAKYLPLLDAINAEGNGGKHVINNPKSMFADGGQLNYQRIDDNFKHLNGIDNIARSIENINFSPTVSVVDINKGQKNLVSVRELAGASN